MKRADLYDKVFTCVKEKTLESENEISDDAIHKITLASLKFGDLIKPSLKGLYF